MMGESPTRPGILKARPLVVVVQEISPAGLMQPQWMVPVGRSIASETLIAGGAVARSFVVGEFEEFSDGGVELVNGWGKPVVAGGVGLFPVEPDLAGLLGEEVFFGETLGASEILCALADEQDVVRLIEDKLGESGCAADVLQRRDSAGAVGRSVHDSRIQFDDAVLIGETAETDGVVLGVVFDERDARDGGVERVGAVLHHLIRLFDGAEAVL